MSEKELCPDACESGRCQIPCVVCNELICIYSDPCLTKALARVKELESALTWYADVETHRPTEAHADGWCRDSGKRARAALGMPESEPDETLATVSAGRSVKE
jgi:hypothetical protein